MHKNDSMKKELAEASKSVTEMSKTMARVKACKAMYVLESSVRTIEDGQTVVKRLMTYHPSKKYAYERMVEQYLEITGCQLTSRDDFVRYVSDDQTVVAMFEIYKPAVG
jgi:hypothetical protein